ncbi:hypothetical protein E4634_19010 [Mangrovimicrobium sediminis]|uniref:Uncharacterized protein n=1 Tax=Mangrovimicrobium sediminis TaxID=2562682 RepID=A0A4Z0LVL5_9GAMM|nr:hypothetical protein [Haliea sp. SAOS-164]TGD71362.1 hypothetical protein E4634_19010 [Haliea sp. SAOS-164]
MSALPELILHIGLDKAGSTALQAALVHSREQLLAQGIFVPPLSVLNTSGHQTLFRRFLDGDAQPLQDALVAAAPYPRCLLSWEGLHFLGDTELQQLHEQLRDYPLRVVFYVREQAAMLQSGLLQELRGVVRRVDFESESRHRELPATRDYHRTIERWNAVFSVRQWDVGLYDRRELPDGDIVADFARRIGCRIESPANSREHNLSLDLPSARFLALLEQLTLPGQASMDRRRRRALVDLLLLDQAATPFPGRRYYLPMEDVERIRAHYAQGNQQLVAQWGVPARLLEPGDLPAETRSVEEQLDFALARSLGSLSRYGGIALLPRHSRRWRSFSHLLVEGWYEPEQWGVWSHGGLSVIRGRVEFALWSLSWDTLVMKIAGRYFGAHTATRLSVNGEDMGTQDLREFELRLDRHRLASPYVVTIELRHEPVPDTDTVREKAASQGDDEVRDLAFGLEVLDIRYE